MSLGTLLSFGYALGWVPLHVFRAESIGAALPLYAPNERLWVRLSVIVLTVHVSASCVILSLAAAPAPWRAWLGAGTFAGAIAFWLWGRVAIGPLRTPRLPSAAPRRLRRDGAFGVVRHPLYLGVLVAAAAPMAVVGLFPLGFTYAACVSVVAVRALQEERRLRSQIGGEYEAYCRSVKRLLPFVWCALPLCCGFAAL